MKIENTWTKKIAAVFLLVLAGCGPRYTGYINANLYDPEAENQNYEPAIVILGGIHFDGKRGIFNLSEERNLRFSFKPLFKVIQIAKGEPVERFFLDRSVQKEGTVLSVPPGDYRLIAITSWRNNYRSKHSVKKSETTGIKYGFSVKSGEVVNLGFVRTFYTRLDRGWLDLEIEAREEAARAALRAAFTDPEPHLAKLETRLLNAPSKLW